MSGCFFLGAWGRGISPEAFDNVGCWKRNETQPKSEEMSDRGHEDAVEAGPSADGRPRSGHKQDRARTNCGTRGCIPDQQNGCLDTHLSSVSPHLSAGMGQQWEAPDGKVWVLSLAFDGQCCPRMQLSGRMCVRSH